MTIIEQARELLALTEQATPGPWCYESCGEKGDGANIIGVAFGPDDEDCQHPLSGRLPEWTEDGEEIEYYRDEEVAVCEHRNRNAGCDTEFITAANPEVIAALCRALIVRTEALRELVACKDLNERALAISPIEPGCEREVLMEEWRPRQRKAWDAARRALADEPHTGQGMSDASDDAADARRFRWLLPRFTAADFEYGEPNPIAVVAFAWPRAPISADLRRSIDDAMKLEATSKAGDSTPGSLRDADVDAGNSDALK